MAKNTWIPIVLLATAGIAAAAAGILLVKAPETPAHGASHHDAAYEPGPGLLIDYNLYAVLEDGSEVLVDTTDHVTAQRGNESGSIRLREPSEYEPFLVEWSRLDRPRLVVEYALSRLDPATLVEGAKIDTIVADAVGHPDEVIHGKIQRTHGPYPVFYNITRAQFIQATGKEPVVGESVNTTAMLVAKVSAIDDDSVRMRVNVNESQAIVSRTLASLFRMKLSEDGEQFWLVLTPVRDSLFTLTEPNPTLGLPKGTYIWDNATDDYVEYLGHARANPLLVGTDYRVQATIHRVDARNG